ncbi:MAG: tRNA (adenosine(37)-N6)-threonylcarbamoyltransferase complex ATPase subunit type 1 TsaE [Patescibacteria group bacterium]
MIKTTSSAQTKKIAKLLAQEILSAKFPRKSALVLALSGDLGAGKTTFVQGFLCGAGIRKKITSPTFVLIKNYELGIKNYGNYKKIYHIDCYRIYKPKDILSTGIKEILNNPENIVLIEWPERIGRILPKTAIVIKLKYGKKENERIIIIKFKK